MGIPLRVEIEDIIPKITNNKWTILFIILVQEVLGFKI
jgi:hypothetical protein